MQIFRIKGTVKDNENKFPIPFLSVQIKNNQTKQLGTMDTNQDGLFGFDVPVGEYELTIKGTGYRPFRRESITINNDKELDILLTPTTMQFGDYRPLRKFMDRKRG